MSRNLISILANNACNLACTHCYLNESETTLADTALRRDEWGKIFASIAATAKSTDVVIAGKEPFLSASHMQLIADLANERQRAEADLRIGLITNGTLLDEARLNVLSTIKGYGGLDWIDFSIDGNERYHNAIRKGGRLENPYQTTLRNMRTMLERGYIAEDSTHILTTISGENGAGIDEMIADVSSRSGVKNYFVSFYKKPHRPQHETPDWSRGVLAQIELAIERSIQAECALYIDMDYRTPAALEALRPIAQGQFTELVQDVYVLQMHEKPHIELRYRAAPPGDWSVRLTHTGVLVPGKHALDIGEYFGPGSVDLREVDFDYAQGYERMVEACTAANPPHKALS